jgi:hypothetical protein
MTRKPVPSIRIGLCGIGNTGKEIARILVDERRGFDLVGAASNDPFDIGREIGAVVSSKTPCAVPVYPKLADVLDLEPDLIVLSTSSFLEEVSDDIHECIRRHCNVISPCEELAYPFVSSEIVASGIDRAARENSVAVVGTGVNPGFLFDFLLLAATGTCSDVRGMSARRVVDVSGFSDAIHTRLGLRLSLAEFNERNSRGAIPGHVGLTQSIQMVAERFGCQLEGTVVETIEPMIDVDSGTDEVRGIRQTAVGIFSAGSRFEIEFILHLAPAAANLVTMDQIRIEGSQPVNLSISPGLQSIPATAAVVVNSIPAVLRGPAGLLTVKDLPPATYWTDLQAPMFR